MRHLKKFNESVNSIDDTFDNIYWQGMEPDESIKNRLNQVNGNFDSYTIRDLLLPLVDDLFIKDLVINKIYKRDRNKPSSKYYYIYVIEVYISLYPKSREDMSRYLKEVDEAREILYRFYGHKSLNREVDFLNYMKSNVDKFDLFSRAIFI
jgi:hypothetical protein